MRPDLFDHLISFDEALERILAAARPIERAESIAPADANGRVAAELVVAPIDVPSFDRAAMDGYAVVAADLVDASSTRPRRLSCVGHLFTGETTDRRLTPGECMAVGTGALVPPGADAVVMVERTSRENDDVLVFAAATAGQHIARHGSDLRAGEYIVQRGDRLGPGQLGALSAVGLPETSVFARPSCAVCSTGNEVVVPGRPLPPGHVYDVNRTTLQAVIRQHGGVAVPMAITADRLEALLATIDEAEGHDVLVCSGGSSVGERDLLLDAVTARGEVIFHGVAVKPGKPTLFGRVGTTHVFGMPGNPTSCLSNAYMLLVPFLRKMGRLPPWRPATVALPLARRVESAPGRHQFYTVRVVDGRVEPVFKSSGDITSLARADGFIQIPASAEAVDAGTLVRVTFF